MEVLNEGINKGLRFELRDPLIHVGRGAHNDVAIADDSVSETHAKLQRRDDTWYVVDLGSTNGTYVAGKRITEEQRVEGASDLRFGGVKLAFRPVAAPAAAAEAKGTRTIASMPADRAQKSREPITAPARSSAPVQAPPERGASRGLPFWIWVVALVAIAAAFFALRG